jgi:GNAT superfamily N-acetyltransferase
MKVHAKKVHVAQKEDESVKAFNDAGPMKIANGWMLYLDEDKQMPVGSAFININTNGALALREVEIAKGMHNKGIGTKFMEQLCKAADDHGWKIVLTPDTYKGSAMGRLKEFYKRFGFVDNKGRNKDWSVRETMYRDAGSLEEKLAVVPPDIRKKRVEQNSKIAKELGLRFEGDYVQLYHGTSKANLSKIYKSGKFKSGTWFATDLETAQKYAKANHNTSAVDTVWVYMGSLVYNGYFSSQEELYFGNNRYSPKDIIYK